MNYSEVLEYLYSRLPMYQRLGAAAYKADLSNTLALARHLKNPEKKFRSIHIAGTNGKGSVAHFLASIFQEAGYKTGLTTSPHLKDFRERCRINGDMISEDFITSFVNQHKGVFEAISPSFFEMSIAMFFQYFADQQVDIAIVETGLGGRLDSTNIITPELSVITNIGLDHMNLLGNTIEQIAAEKAGIIKKNIPVVTGPMRSDAEKVIEQWALEMGSPIYQAKDRYQYVTSEKIWSNHQQVLNISYLHNNLIQTFTSSLIGNYQKENISTVAIAVDVINSLGLFNLTPQNTKDGILNVVKNTAIAGRWQILGTQPITICDTGHNEDGIKAVLENIATVPHNRLHFVMGLMNDKDISGILKLLPRQNATYYFCKPDVPRAMDADKIAKIAENEGLEGIPFTTVKEALARAKENAAIDDMIFIGGSTFVVAEVV